MHDQIVRRAPAVVMLPGEIDVSNAQRVFDQLSSAFAAGATVVIADLTKTVFCDSTGLGTLLRVQRQAAATAPSYGWPSRPAVRCSACST
jgi:anti-sigma B factor antagonist